MGCGNIATVKRKIELSSILPEPKFNYHIEEDCEVIHQPKSLPKSNLEGVETLIEKNKEKLNLENDNLNITETVKEPETNLIKPKKVRFDVYPHEFDFSFIQEGNQLRDESDLLTDQLLRELTSN